MLFELVWTWFKFVVGLNCFELVWICLNKFKRTWCILFELAWFFVELVWTLFKFVCFWTFWTCLSQQIHSILWDGHMSQIASGPRHRWFTGSYDNKRQLLFTASDFLIEFSSVLKFLSRGQEAAPDADRSRESKRKGADFAENEEWWHTDSTPAPKAGEGNRCVWQKLCCDIAKRIAIENKLLWSTRHLEARKYWSRGSRTCDENTPKHSHKHQYYPM